MKFTTRAVVSIFVLVAVICSIQAVDSWFAANKWEPLKASDWASWVQAVGSIGAILAAIWVMNRQNDVMTRRDAAASKSETASILRAVAAELQTHLGSIAGLQNIGPTVIIPHMDFRFHIYHSCAGSIGKIDDRELMVDVINLYAAIETLYQRSNHRTVVLEALRAGPVTAALISQADAFHAGYLEWAAKVHACGPPIVNRINNKADAMLGGN